MSRRARHLLFLAAAAVTGIFFVNWCAIVFRCGCRSLWNGIAAACNIHDASGPHCPWCEHPLAGGGTAFAAAIALQWLVVYRAPVGGALTRGLLALGAFPAASGLAAWIQAWWWSYGPG